MSDDNSLTYPITRWDGITQASAKSPQPGLYFVPDGRLTNLPLGEPIGVAIEGTGSPMYDGQIVFATIQSTALTGGYRPNFEAATGTLVALPNIVWQGYPPQMGQLRFVTADPSDPTLIAPDLIREAFSFTPSEWGTYTQYAVATGAVFVVGIAALLMFGRRRKRARA